MAGDFIDIRIKMTRLTDGSSVYDVMVPAMLLEAVTLQDARVAARNIAEAINTHTNNTCEVSEDGNAADGEG